MRPFVTACAASIAVLVLAASACAQNSPLPFFSRDVAVLIRLKEPDRTRETIVKLADRLQPGLGEQVRQQSGPFLGQAISNPALIGVDQSRDWYAGVYLERGEEPVVVFAIPAVSTDDLVAAVGAGMQTSVHGTWVLYTESEEIPKGTEEMNAVGLFSDRGKAAFEEGALSILVNVARVSGTYAEELELGQEQMLEGLNTLRFALPQDAGVDLGPAIELYGAVAEGLFQGIDDARSLVASVSVGEEGIGIEELVEFAEETASSRYLAGIETSSMPLLERLPADALVYYGFSGQMRELTRWSLKLSSLTFQNEEQGRKLEEALERLDEIDFGTLAGAIQAGDAETGAFRFLSIAEASPADKIREFNRESVRAVGEVEVEGFRTETSVEENAEMYGPHQADIVTVRQEHDAEADPLGIQSKIQSILFGDGPIQTRIVYLEDKYLSSVGGGRQAMTDLLAALEQTRTNTLQKHRQPLLEEANLVALLDLPRMVAEGLRVAGREPDIRLPIDEQMINNLNLSPSYLGFAIGVEPNALRCQTHIPTDQMTGIAKLGILLMALQMQPQF